jgi:hypothetical protein
MVGRRTPASVGNAAACDVAERAGVTIDGGESRNQHGVCVHVDCEHGSSACIVPVQFKQSDAAPGEMLRVAVCDSTSIDRRCARAQCSPACDARSRTRA